MFSPREELKEEELTCPLSAQIFLDPVRIPVGSVKQDGGNIINKYVSVEKEVILKWINENGNNPYTREPLLTDELIPDEEMKKKVSLFLEKYPDKKEFQYTLITSSTSNHASAARGPSEPTADDLLAIAEAQGIQPHQEYRPNLFQRNNPNPQLEELNRRLHIAPGNINARCRRASILSSNNSVAALQDYDYVLERYPNNVEARLGRASIYERDDRLEDALQDYRYVLEKYPVNTVALQAVSRLTDENTQSL